MKSLLPWVWLHPTPFPEGKSPQAYGVEAPQETSSHSGSANEWPKDTQFQTGWPRWPEQSHEQSFVFSMLVF